MKATTKDNLKSFILFISLCLFTVWVVAIAIISLDDTLAYQELQEDNYQEYIYINEQQ
jgi:hypothetical protein